jgi:drug/metabolite transporter (DMT)-like permease
MDSRIALLVLLSAAFHAGWNALVKGRYDKKIVSLAKMSAGSAVISIVVLPFLEWPAPPCFVWLIVSAALHTGYKLFLLRSYEHGDLAQMYPMARGSAPLLVAVASWCFLSEEISAITAAAILVLSAGIALLSFRGGNMETPRTKPMLYALGTGFFIASYTAVDAFGSRLSGRPHGFAAWLFVLDGITFVGLVAIRERSVFTQISKDWRYGLWSGAMSLAAYWLIIWAATIGPVAPVAALRETSVLFAALIGAMVLKEPMGPWRIAATLIVLVGILMLRLG